MSSWEEEEIKHKKRGIILFKYFIQFLEIYGQENFGESVEINWPRVYETCNSFGIFDFNEELENMIYSKDEEEFRDKAFKWIEDQVLLGLPIWRLFDLNNWLSQKLEDEVTQEEHKKDVEFFNTCKCFTCKYYHDHVEWFDKKTGYPHDYNEGEGDFVKPPKYVNLMHNLSCRKRNQLAESHRHKHRYLGSYSDGKFQYKYFNMTSESQTSSKWKLYPDEHDKCPYYEKDEEMTFEKFVKKYGEILR